ncbi:MAG: hypothetical protein A3F72_15675 [Bacteroidetes bacterium RIFCSPLOWO2_12_FULL_35_15]|nr:MAG: hypothetical protein A3F72_15675 [Bacteroidetes bacterium RIFCSPLOWO2_12_FULL_35_15]
MQNKTFYNFIKRLLTEGKINASSLGSSIRRSDDYKTLLEGGFLETTLAVTGGGSVIVKNKQALEKYFSDKFPSELQNTFTAIANVNSLRNTKAGKRISQNVVLIRGQKHIVLNGTNVDLKKYTDTFGTFSASLNGLETDKICFVENLDSFFLAEEVIGNDYVFIHTYGGMGKSVINKVSAKEILIFPDYDFKGLHNYLLVKSIFTNTKLFIPDNYEALFSAKSRTIKTKQGREQQPSKQVLESDEKNVVKIRSDIFKHKKFLEQQALFK